MNQKKTLQYLIALMGLLALTVEARVKAVPFKYLLTHSAVVVVGNVNQVTQASATKYADVNILTRLRGNKNARTIRYIASPTWACDSSDAKEGEKAIYLLQKTKQQKIYELAAAGRGRFVIENFKGEEYIVVLKANDGDVVYPTELKIYDHPAAEEKYLGLIRVQDLVGYMKKELGT